MEFKDVIKDLRSEKGISINREPNLQQIKRICLFFDVSADYVVGLINENL